MAHPDIERWTRPLDLATLGEFNAQWLEGSGWAPWNNGPPDPETAALVPYLAAMNRGGYATDFSQPGMLDDAGSQRATVSGYCARGQAECLASLSLVSDLVVVAHFPGAPAFYELAITQDDEHRTFTKLAGHWSDLLPDLWEGIHEQTVSMLSECYYLAICDPRWGRDELLWPSIVAALDCDPQECRGSILAGSRDLGSPEDAD